MQVMEQGAKTGLLYRHRCMLSLNPARLKKEHPMTHPNTAAIRSIFASRLDTLAHLIGVAEKTFAADDAFLKRSIAPDMAPFGTQVAFTCNQPRNFARWAQGKQADNLDPNVHSVQQAKAYIQDTKDLLFAAPVNDSALAERTRVDLGPGLYAEMSGEEYVNDFLMPNFYFHLVTAYDILRMTGLAIGKRDYMLHLLPLVRQA
jgi:hypothetical protein